MKTTGGVKEGLALALRGAVEDDRDLFDAHTVPRNIARPRGPGRPRGARNRRTEETAVILVGRFGDPRAGGTAIANAWPDTPAFEALCRQLCRRCRRCPEEACRGEEGCDRPWVADYQRRVAEAVFPYLFQRLPTAADTRPPPGRAPIQVIDVTPEPSAPAPESEDGGDGAAPPQR